MTSVDLPGDLVAEARARGVSVSGVAEHALRRAVSAAGALEGAAADVQEAVTKVAERLGLFERSGPPSPEERENRLREVAEGLDRVPSPAEQARSSAISWARNKATTADLWYVAEYPGPVDEFRAPDSLFNRLAPETAEFAYRYRGHPGRSDWPFFQAAVHEVWQALRPFL
jgi:post-segregation antitoxin (ccd killing protein)